MGGKVFKDSICSHFPEHSVKMKHWCQPLTIVFVDDVCQMSILYSQFLCILLVTVTNITILTSVRGTEMGNAAEKGILFDTGMLLNLILGLIYNSISFMF